MKKLIFLIFTFVLAGNFAIGQVAMNNWRVHYALSNSVGITHTESKVYMAGINGVVVYDSEDNSVSSLTLANGLSDYHISAIGSNSEIVIIGYLNGNIDVIKNNTTINVPWLKKAQLPGSKIVNNFLFFNEDIYISTNSGLLVYNIAKNEISDTYYPDISAEINDICVFNDSFFVATNQGIYTASINQDYLNNANNWTKKSNLPFHLNNSKISEVETFNNHLVFSFDTAAFNADSIFKMNASNVFENFTPTGTEAINIKKADNELLVSVKYSLRVYDDNFNITNSVYDYAFGLDLDIAGAVKLNNELWIADKNNGLVRANDSWNNKQVFNNVPFNDIAYRVDIQYGKMVVASGAVTHNLLNNFMRNGIYVFESETWSNLNFNNDPLMDFYTSWDFISVSINPNNTEQVAIGTYSRGGLKIINKGKVVSEYTSSNSPIEEQLGNTGVHIIGDVKYDNDQNLWIANQGNNPLKVLTKDSVWYEFNLGSAAKNKYPYRLLIDSKGYKWVGINSVGIAVYDDNGTIEDPSDDRLVLLKKEEGYGNLPSTAIKAIAEDIDGEIWIGTEEGLTVVFSTEKLFDGGYGDADATQINLEYGENVEHLLGESDITAIAIDGGNRKWVGTSSSGVFCFSPNGLEEIYRFTAENSPLLSNSILDIKINHLTGEVFFVTENGLVSFQSDATIGDEEFSEVTVFPNPVKPDFNGNITIQGLGYDSDVKITDVSGNLIYQTTSNGGTVIWDGKRLTGERVQTGIYLVWTASPTGKGKNVAKIAIIN